MKCDSGLDVYCVVSECDIYMHGQVAYDLCISATMYNVVLSSFFEDILVILLCWWYYGLILATC